jgi:hypothetical protein
VLSGFRFVYPIDVAFRDIDAMAHVNNTIFLRYQPIPERIRALIRAQDSEVVEEV